METTPRPPATPRPSGPEAWPDWRPVLTHPAVLLACRLLVGGLLIFAASQKMRSPKAFALSIDAFAMVPTAWVPSLAFLFIWQEIVAGGMLILGFWSRAAALVSTGLLVVFLGALGWALAHGLSIDCGCFGDLFGGPIGWASLARNLILIALALWIVLMGGGGIAIERLWTQPRTPAQA